MSRIRHVEPLVRSWSGTHPPGALVLPVGPGWDQLLYAASGAMTVSTAGGTWVIPAHRALWVPDGAPATVTVRARTAVRGLYLAASLRNLPAEARAVNVTPLARELLLHAVRLAPLDLGVEAHRAVLTLLLDQLATLPDAPLQLPAPRDDRARALAALLAADPAVALDAAVAGVAASRRTLERSFAAETGLSLGGWHRRARLLRALELLAGGSTVTATAVAVGYSTPSSFVAAFRRELGHTPGELRPR